jgi:hypothetical protein
MYYDTQLPAVWSDAEHAEEMLPSLTYRQLVENLEPLAETGVIAEGSLPMMLVVARLMDRRRILQAGMTAADLRRALDDYRRAARWRPVWAVEDALEHAIRILRQAEAPLVARAESENEAQAAAYAAR